jgi:hypothetical protein
MPSRPPIPLGYGPKAVPDVLMPDEPFGARRRTAVVWRRMLRVLRLDRTVYVEVERDPHGTRQAAVVVGFVAAFAALGTLLIESWHAGAILGAIVAALLHWLLWSGLTYLLGGIVLRRRLSFEHLVRALGYAQTPQLLTVFAFVPVAGPWIVVVGRLLSLVAGNLAIGTAAETNLPRALAIRLLSFGVALAAAAGVRAVLGEVGFVMALLRP